MNFNPIKNGVNSAIDQGKQAGSQAGPQATPQPGNAPNGISITALQAKLQDHEMRIKRLEGLVGHQNSTIAALQTGKSAQSTGVTQAATAPTTGGPGQATYQQGGYGR